MNNAAPTAANAHNAGSQIAATLENVYASIRTRHPELPPAVTFVTGSGITARGVKWGHFGADRWVARTEIQTKNLAGQRLRYRITNSKPNRAPEIFIGGERLACGARDTLQTLLHEAAHALAHVRGIEDCSHTGRHNKEFRKVAEEMGLTYPHGKADAQLGYSAVVLTPETEAAYAAEIAILEAPAHLDTLARLGMTLVGGTGGIEGGGDGSRKVKGTRKGPDRNLLKCVCGCEEPTVIRMSRKNADRMNVRCEDCGEKFAPEGER